MHTGVGLFYLFIGLPFLFLKEMTLFYFSWVLHHRDQKYMGFTTVPSFVSSPMAQYMTVLYYIGLCSFLLFNFLSISSYCTAQD